jgi:hypothetical protein
MHEVPVYIQRGGTIRRCIDDVAVPNFVEQSARLRHGPIPSLWLSRWSICRSLWLTTKSPTLCFLRKYVVAGVTTRSGFALAPMKRRLGAKSKLNYLDRPY